MQERRDGVQSLGSADWKESNTMTTRRSLLTRSAGSIAAIVAGSIALERRAAASTASPFTVPLRWAIRSESETTQQIPELHWEVQDIQAPHGSEGSWETSPDLRLDPYFVPADAVAVDVLIKNKVLCHTIDEFGDGTLAIAVAKIGGSGEGNYVLHNRRSKGPNQAGVTEENVAYGHARVELVDGRFLIKCDWSIYNHVLLTRDVFLSGYGIP
jgi:hypothetical protein